METLDFWHSFATAIVAAENRIFSVDFAKVSVVSDLEPSRYHRQELIDGIGIDGQRRLRSAHALVVGCGALGCAIVEILARAGIGKLTIVDRDVVEITNLQRQTLYSERDAALAVPKAEAAKRRVGEINSEVVCRGWVDHIGAENALSYASDADVILDGLDNLRTRFLLNDVATSLGKPYFYGGAVATRGMSMPVLPGEACLRCVFPDPFGLGTQPTCDTVGVLMSTVVAVGAHQAAQSIKWIVGAHDTIDRSLWSIDAWTNRTNRIALAAARDANCVCCGQRKFDFLAGQFEEEATVLCGRNAVQIAPHCGAVVAVGTQGRNGGQVPTATTIDLVIAATRLAPHGSFEDRSGRLVGTFNAVRAPNGSPVELTLFADGRAIIRGSTDPIFARSIYDRFVGVL